MFTGIIEELGSLKNLSEGSIEIFCEKILSDIKIGDSICVNGVCLTATNFTENFFTADVMPETLRRSSLSELRIGGVVNLERAMKISDRFGGHIVSGHIDGVGKILNLRAEGNAIFINISAEKNLLRRIAEKGSVALDGISLTVVDSDFEKFSVSMIPHTREVTNFKFKRVGSLVNIETDILAKYIDRLMNFKNPPQNLTKEFLLENGF